MKRKLTIFRPLLILSTSKQNFILKNCFQAEVFILNLYSERILIEERERERERGGKNCREKGERAEFINKRVCLRVEE